MARCQVFRLAGPPTVVVTARGVYRRLRNVGEETRSPDPVGDLARVHASYTPQVLAEYMTDRDWLRRAWVRHGGPPVPQPLPRHEAPAFERQGGV